MKNRKRLIFILCLPVLQLSPYFSFGQGIEIQTGASITNTGAATIEINNGGFINNGTYTKASETVTFSGATPKTISGSSITDMYILAISNTGGITIVAGEKLSVSNTLTNSAGTAGLVIQSTSDGATGTASLINSTTGVSATVERWMTGDLWHLISPAATGGETVADFVDTTQNDNLIARNATNYAFASYIESNDSWDYFKVAGISGSLDVSGKGYQVLRATGAGTGNGNTADNGIVSFKGTLAAEDKTTGITKTAATGNGWNLIGNPYPCAMDVKLFLENNANVAAIDPSYRAIYVADITNTTTYGYTPVNFADNPELKLASSEGFFVKSVAGGGTVNFTTAMKSHISSVFKSAVIQNGFNLIAESAGIKMGTSVKYIPQMTAGLDPGWDAGLFYNGDDVPLSLFTRLVEDNGVDFTIQCLPDYDYENLVVPVGITAKQGTTVIFSLTDVTVPAGYKVFLEDKVSGKFTRLDEQGSIYRVQINADSNGTGRFFLHTKQEITGIKDGISNHIVVIPLPQHSIIRVSGLVNLPAQATVYDMNGRMIAIKKLTGLNENEIPLQGVSNGIYLINIKSDKETTQCKFSWSL